MERDFAAPRQAVWDLVTSPQHHARWQRSDGVVENNAQGRRGAGTQNHCLHGKDAVIEDIVDWRPFDYVTLTALLPIPGAPKILFSYTFEERDDGGTHFEFRVAKPKPKDLPFYERVRPTIEANFTAGFDILRTMVAERRGGFDGRERAASARLARALPDAAAPHALASAAEATRQSVFDTKHRGNVRSLPRPAPRANAQSAPSARARARKSVHRGRSPRGS